MNDNDEFDILKKYAIMDLESQNIKDFEEKGEWKITRDKPYAYINMLTKVMEHLEATGGVEFAILKDPELGRWWTSTLKKRELERKIKAAKEKLDAALTKEEQKLLGIVLQ